MLSWTDPTEYVPFGPVEGVEVEVYKVGQSPIIHKLNPTDQLSIDLQEGQEVKYRIAYVNSIGRGMFSDNFTVTYPKNGKLIDLICLLYMKI